MSTLDPNPPSSAPQSGAGARLPTHEAWLEALDAHAEEHGFHARLGPIHGALYTEDDDTLLLVSFESAADIRATEPALPFGLKAAGKAGWSQLTIYSEAETWFRDEDVYAFFDDLVDDGFFDLFDTVLFYGVGAGGYAACAYSVTAPFSRVLAVRPQATLDPARTGWDRRFLSARRLSFSDRYGDAPALLEAAERAAIVHDPLQREDAMHAALFGPRALQLRTPYLGSRPETLLDGMGVLEGALRLLAKDRLTAQSFAHLYRRRRRSAAYLRRVLTILERAERPYLQALWCRAALRETDRPRLREGLHAAEVGLRDEGRALPPPAVPAHDVPAAGASR